MFSLFSQQVMAGSVLGVHILQPSELQSAVKLIKTNSEDWQYVTIPLTLADTDKKDVWQDFFNKAAENKVKPIVRLATRFDGQAWVVPNRKEIVDQINFLNGLIWPSQDRLIVLFNEPNHSKEWGGTIDPQGYAAIANFAADWAHTSDPNFVVLPAGLDLAAPNGRLTMDAFAYLDQMISSQPELFQKFDAWNSHSYPNPAFSASPEMNGQNSLRGFQIELSYLKSKTNRDFSVYITETGWVNSNKTSRWLTSYYKYAVDNVWSDPRVIAVTPFVLQGAPGPFANFSFLDAQGEPTPQYAAFQSALKKI